MGRQEDMGWDVVWFPVPAYTCLVPYGAYKLAEKILGVLEVSTAALLLHAMA